MKYSVSIYNHDRGRYEHVQDYEDRIEANNAAYHLYRETNRHTMVWHDGFKPELVK